MSKSASVLPIDPDAEAEPRLARRTFTAEYKAKILAECDAADQPGQIGAILRREGLYSSHLADWRKRRAEAGPRRIGRPPVGPAVLEQRKELERMKRENTKLSEKLRKAEIIIDAQKKLAEVLSSLRTASGNSE